MNIKVIIATHKKYQMPNDEMYIPIHVGAKGKATIGYTGDDSGDNISEKNPQYCELTGMYWAWKNLEADYYGLAHYRRHFKGKNKSKDLFKQILTKEEVLELTKKNKIIVPKKRKYYIETLYSHYSHTHYAEHLDITREIISEKYPEYVNAYDEVVKQTYGHMFNMMIMEKTFYNDYCEWLFDILFELEKRVPTQELSAFQNRFYGRVSEIIFNVWLKYQIDSGTIQKNEVAEIPCMHMEKIDWVKKGTSFLKAKFFSKRYEGSF